MSSEAKATIRSYLKKYADKHNVTIEEAREHAICKLTELYLEDHKSHNSDVFER